MKNEFKKYLRIHDNRLKSIVNNSLNSIGARVIDLVLEAYMLFLIIENLNLVLYGFILLIYGASSWLNFLTSGVSSYARNRLFKNESETKQILKQVSSYLLVLFLVIIVLGFVIGVYNSQTNFFDLEEDNFTNEITILVIATISFALKPVSNFVNALFFALHRPKLNDFRTTLSRLVSVILIYITYTLDSDIYTDFLRTFVIVMITPHIISFLSGYIILKRKKIRISELTPKFSLLTSGSDLLKVSYRFTLLTIGRITMILSFPFIISGLYGLEKSGEIQTTYKIFNYSYSFIIIAIQPLWNHIRENNNENNFGWIKMTLKKYYFLMGLYALILLIIYVITPYVLKEFSDGRFETTPIELFVFCLLFMTQVLNQLFTAVVNAFEYLVVHIKVVFGAIILYATLNFIFYSWTKLNATGVVIALTISLAVVVILKAFHVNLILNKKNSGVWSK